MSRIPPEFMLMFTDGWVRYSQHDLVSSRLEGEQDGRDGTHVTVVTAETGVQVRTQILINWDYQAYEFGPVITNMSSQFYLKIKLEAACEPAVGVVCGTEEAVWKKPCSALWLHGWLVELLPCFSVCESMSFGHRWIRRTQFDVSFMGLYVQLWLEGSNVNCRCVVDRPGLRLQTGAGAVSSCALWG